MLKLKNIMVRKRIYNSKTKKYYAVRQKTTNKGMRGQILGGYKKQVSNIIKKDLSRAIKKLGDT